LRIKDGGFQSMVATSPAIDVRAQLISAAEDLFASCGIRGVSLREINRRARQGNVSALQYHFGDRDGLLQAVLEKHRRVTEPQRHVLLDRYEASAIDDLRQLAATLVLPLASKLGDPNGGREYLQIASEHYTQAGSLEELVPDKTALDSMRRWHQLVDPLLPQTERTVLHSRFPAIRLVFSELARRAKGVRRRDDRLFTSQLIDIVTAVLVVQPSAETNRLIRTR
jgi:AcrR family transcriptional regulator